MKDVMIDIETLATTPDAVILSIAAVQFDRHTGETGHDFYSRIDRSQPGRTVCDKTEDWWKKQPLDVLIHAATGTAKLNDALLGLSIWFDSDMIAWAQGPDFDLTILDHAFAQRGFESPWQYNAKRDTRTVYDICGFDPKLIERQGTYHNALDDCHHQIRCVVAALKGIRCGT